MGVFVDDILFDFDSSVLRSEHNGKLDGLGNYLVKNPGTLLVVGGFADSVGDDEYNLWLSKRRALSIKTYLKSDTNEVTDEEVAYFRDHPEQIDEISAPVVVHKLFLWVGALLGTACVGLSKAFKFSQTIILSEGFLEFVVDIIFEVGVALIGAAVTAYILGILLNQQQDNAAVWRSEIRRRIGVPES